MPHSDCEHFSFHAAEFERATGLEVRSCQNGKLHFPFIKIVNPAIRAQEENFDGFYEGYLWVDVFPIDAVPDSDAEYKKSLDIATFESHLSLWGLRGAVVLSSFGAAL